jgi:MFS family permease
MWGGLQLATGWLSDLTGRKPLIVAGMLLQAGAIAAVGWVDAFGGWLVALAVLGLGTAMVYPALLAATGDAVHPGERATALGVYRFWRDAGAIVGALGAGLLADAFGFVPAIQSVAVVTAGSGILAGAMLHTTPNVQAKAEAIA